jgi:hypothetical protein
MTKLTITFRNFANALKNVFFAITLFNLKLTCKKIQRKDAMDLLAANTADLLIGKGRKAKLSCA